MRPKTTLTRLVQHRQLYLLILPTVLFYIAFCYLPMYGIILAFKEFDYSKGIFGSPWIGLANFQEIFQYSDFWQAFANTLIIALLRLTFEFPIPIFLALMLNEVRVKAFKGGLQTVLTFPHFISWIIISGMALNIFGDAGTWNQVANLFGLPKNNFMISNDTFRWFLVFSDMWKEAGWGTIIYLAAIAGISPELYEAASIDGASRWQQIKSITLPSIQSVVAVTLILFLSSVMNSGGGGFDQVFNLYHPGVYETGDIIDTYIYRRTFMEGFSFGTSTAVGVLKSVINCGLVLGANALLKKMGEEALF